MIKFRIDKEIKSFLPPQRADERQRLEKKIIEEGPLKGSIIVGDIDGDCILIDGHNTLEICEENEIDAPQAKVIKFTNRTSVLQWMVDNQFSRRNLTDEQKHYFIGKEYLIEKKPKGGDREPKAQNAPLISTAEQIGQKHGVNQATVKRDAEFAKGVDKLKPEAKAKVLSGEKTQTKSQIATGIFCDSCKENGPRNYCRECFALREKAGIDEHGRKIKKEEPKKQEVKREVVKDKLGHVVPDSCRDAFADPSLKDMIEEIEAIAAMMTPESWTKKAGKLCDHYGFILIDKFQERIFESLSQMQLAVEALKAGLPFAVCPKCDGIYSKDNGKCCRTCRGYGHIPKHRHEELSRE